MKNKLSSLLAVFVVSFAVSCADVPEDGQNQDPATASEDSEGELSKSEDALLATTCQPGYTYICLHTLPPAKPAVHCSCVKLP